MTGLSPPVTVWMRSGCTFATAIRHKLQTLLQAHAAAGLCQRMLRLQCHGRLCQQCHMTVQADMLMQTLPEEGEEVVIWEGCHALCDDITRQAELHRDAAVVKLLLHFVIQAAHVAQPVWSEVQDLLCLQRVVHLQGKHTCTQA